MWRAVWFQVHWCIGITAGIVLAIVGVTGAFLSFEEPILRTLNPGLVTVAPRSGPALELAQLVDAVRERNSDRQITSLQLVSDPGHAARVTLARVNGAGSPGRRGESFYVDPHDGRVLGKERRGEKFLHFMEDVHRRLAAGVTGKAIVGASTMLLVLMCLTGLYLRWPAFARRLRSWFAFDFSLKGRPLLWNLHAVAGTWCLVLYLLAALTGLHWSYEWYRDGLYALTGAQRATPSGGRGQGTAVPTHAELARVWDRFRVEAARFTTATVNFPQAPGLPVEIRYLTGDAAHERAYDRIAIEPATGNVVSHERYADKNAGAKLMSSLFVLHSGAFFGLPGKIAMMLASLAMPLFAVTGWMLYLERRGRKRRARLRASSALASERAGSGAQAGAQPVRAVAASRDHD